jgi:hypothetical protein
VPLGSQHLGNTWGVTYNIIVPSSAQLLKDIVRNKEGTGLVGKWVVELNKFVIDFVHHSSIQSQALVDFIVDWITTPQDVAIHDEAICIVFYDGSWGSFGAGVVAIIDSPSKLKTLYAAKLEFQCTKNIMELEAILLGLRKLKAMSIERAILNSDSQVITCNVDKSCRVRSPTLEKYLRTV